MKIGFDNEKYLKMQSEHIRDRINQFDNKLYLEFGGKLFDDFHASRVLPGFAPDAKLRMLMQLSDQAEIVMAISAADIEKNKIRGDLGITYDSDVLRLIDEFRGRGLYVGSVVITQYSGQHSADAFKKRLQKLGIPVYIHYTIPGYPHNVPLIVSDEGYGKNEYIETTRPLVVVTAPGPGSGKMATCLSQLYHEHKRGVHAGYAKYETFPIWNLPLKHPVNLAYEAATADLNDVNMIDPFHLEAYGVTTVNYNRDVEIFPVLRAIFQQIFGESPYKSPTDMGVNMAGNCIIDDEACREASRQEIIRRYYTAVDGIADGSRSEDRGLQDRASDETGKHRCRRPHHRFPGSRPCRSDRRTGCCHGTAGRTRHHRKDRRSAWIECSASAECVKELSGIDHDVHVLSPESIAPIQTLKTKYLGSKNPRLHTDEVLIALSATAAQSEDAQKALSCLPQLKSCQVHSSVMLSDVDRKMFQRLGCDLTCEPKFQ